ncbi:hypothetical protein [Gymnodinialimonas ulvae]|uniref:hypothetical protein n=1 Tax=Gymnodinialimonas ulvae TaxID=3126504 RepID=UPI0030A2EE68
MRAILAGVLMLGAAPGAGQAQDWLALSGAEIAEILIDRDVIYHTGATQRFHASGRTLYTHREPSWGTWRVENNSYCSQWPSAPTWECYAVESANPDGIVFLDGYGNRYEGRIVAE